MKKNILSLSLLLLVVIIFSSFVYRNGTGEKVGIERIKAPVQNCLEGTISCSNGAFSTKVLSSSNLTHIAAKAIIFHHFLSFFVIMLVFKF